MRISARIMENQHTDFEKKNLHSGKSWFDIRENAQKCQSGRLAFLSLGGPRRPLRMTRLVFQTGASVIPIAPHPQLCPLLLTGGGQ